MFFLLPQGKYSRILETMEIEEDNCSPYLVPRISSNKQTERNRNSDITESHLSNQKQCWTLDFLQTLGRNITLQSANHPELIFKDKNF